MSKKTDYSFLLDWEGPSIQEMLEELVERYPESLNDIWDVFSGKCIDVFDHDIERSVVEKKCISMGIPYNLIQYVMSDCYDNNDFMWILSDEHGMPLEKNIELGIAKNIKMIADEWLENPDQMYRKLYNLLY